MKHAALLVLLTCFAVPALAGNGNGGNRGGGGGGGDGGNSGGQERNQDHDRAREAVKRREARPLADILPAIEQRYQARMVAVTLEAMGARLTYRLELITAAGRIIDVVVDAATGDIVDDDIGN